jgi:dGTPase
MNYWRDNNFYGDFDLETLPGKRPVGDHRSPFAIDRDRVVFSYAFRRLQSKTQVFQSGEFDFYRTRLTHSMEVARIGRSICDYLEHSSPLLHKNHYLDPDLTEGICLAHDLGHPPFGHIGERKLNEMMGPYGGFEGNGQTLRIITKLIYAREKGNQTLQDVEKQVEKC